MQFSDLLRAAKSSEGVVEAAVSADWLQGRSAFGGLQGAIGLLAMRTRVSASLPLRTLQMTFIAPIPEGRVRAEAGVLREGKSATHVEAHLLDGSQRLATLVGVFGAPRASAVQHLPTRPNVAARPDAVTMPYVPGITPEFTRHFASRWLRGGLPFTASASRETVVELDMRDEGPASEAHVLAIADFVPPVALSLLQRPSAGSSLTWMLELFGSGYAHLPLAGWRVDSEMVAAQEGYTSQSNRIWAPDGSLAALSRQSMVVFG